MHFARVYQKYLDTEEMEAVNCHSAGGTKPLLRLFIALDIKHKTYVQEL